MILSVRVIPRSPKSAISGRRGDAIVIRLAAPPVDGAANDALLRFLAERLKVGLGALELVGGHTGRSKVVVVIGLSPAEVAAKLLP